jgi:hypothetical protein
MFYAQVALTINKSLTKSLMTTKQERKCVNMHLKDTRKQEMIMVKFLLADQTI